VPEGEISVDDPRAGDVRELLERHLAFAHENTPPQDIHALDADRLLDPAITFFSFRCRGELLAVGALKDLGERHTELKSMHTAAAARGRGIGRAMLEHLIGVARERGCRRVSLETGSMDGFAPARSLYASAGFQPCGPFGDYAAAGAPAAAGATGATGATGAGDAPDAAGTSTFMTLILSSELGT
jgi:putative acetyltransferase